MPQMPWTAIAPTGSSTLSFNSMMPIATQTSTPAMPPITTALIGLTWVKQVGVADKYIQQSEPDQELAFQKAFTIELCLSLGFLVVVATQGLAVLAAVLAPRLGIALGYVALAALVAGLGLYVFAVASFAVAYTMLADATSRSSRPRDNPFMACVAISRSNASMATGLDTLVGVGRHFAATARARAATRDG